MNNATGKRLLALVRDADYAHPGEEAANELLFAGAGLDPRRRVLDAGCGGAGTASWVQGRGLGAVTGIEIDSATARLAREGTRRSRSSRATCRGPARCSTARSTSSTR